MPIDPLATRLADKLTASLVGNLNERRDEILGGLGVVARAAAGLVWNPIMHAVPPAAEAGLDAILDEFGELSLRDLLEFLARHNEARGRYDLVAKYRGL